MPLEWSNYYETGVRERSGIVHCTRFDGFRFFFRDGHHDEIRSQAGISINSTYRLFLHIFFFLSVDETRETVILAVIRYAMCN